MPHINKYTDIYHLNELSLIKESIVNKNYDLGCLVGDLKIIQGISKSWGVNNKTPYQIDGLAVPVKYLPVLKRIEGNYNRLLRPVIKDQSSEVAVFLHRSGFKYEVLYTSDGGSVVYVYINQGALIFTHNGA
jgi:hypothetical protein